MGKNRRPDYTVKLFVGADAGLLKSIFLFITLCLNVFVLLVDRPVDHCFSYIITVKRMSVVIITLERCCICALTFLLFVCFPE